MTVPTDDVFIALQRALAREYSLEGALGRGGMGIVYLAREVSLDRYVALKLLPPHLAARTALRERFVREACTAAKLSHPNIVPISRDEERDGFVFFAMSFVEGETLTNHVKARGPMSESSHTTLMELSTRASHDPEIAFAAQREVENALR
jgi:eukaryotic-like serine/threonine-protein kinase